jgi:hypothetical protein
MNLRAMGQRLLLVYTTVGGSWSNGNGVAFRDRDPSDCTRGVCDSISGCRVGRRRRIDDRDRHFLPTPLPKTCASTLQIGRQAP